MHVFMYMYVHIHAWVLYYSLGTRLAWVPDQLPQPTGKVCCNKLLVCGVEVGCQSLPIVEVNASKETA